MSIERRTQLIEHIVEIQPQLREFIRALPAYRDMMAGSWDLLAYSFERGFEAMWDQARVDHSGLLLRPLLLLWRQSVELALKAAITEIAGGIDGRPGHDLVALFDQLNATRAALGYCNDDELTLNVRETVTLVQSLDPFADRFRYPSARGGMPFEGVSADLDELFQAHWITVTYCDGAATEVRENRSFG